MEVTVRVSVVGFPSGLLAYCLLLLSLLKLLSVNGPACVIVCYTVGMALPQTQWDAMVKNANEEAHMTSEKMKRIMEDRVSE